MLTEAQIKFLLEASSSNGIYAISTYPPASKLSSLGFIEDVRGRWYITRFGRTALRALQEKAPPRKTGILQKYRVISPMLQSGDPQTCRQAVAILEPALHETQGNVMQAAKLIGASHRQMCRWLAMSEELQRLVEDLRNEYAQKKRIA